MTFKCGRCGKEIKDEIDPAIATYDDGRKEKICSPCIMATLGPDNEEW